MAVAFDAVGPSSSGAAANATSTLSWTHTAAGSGVWLLIGATIDTTVSVTATCTLDGGSNLATLGHVNTSNSQSSTTTSYVQVWYVSGVAAGAHTVKITCSAAPDHIVGGSISFTGASGLGTAAFNGSASITTSVAVSPTTSGNMVAGFCGVGNDIVSSGNTSRFINNDAGSGGDDTGNAAGATAASTGSTVTMSWTNTTSGDSWCAIGAEVQGSVTAAGPPLVTLPGSRPVVVAGYAGRTGAGHSL